MLDCTSELESQHHRGSWGGFGPVRGSESVVLAVFESMKLNGRSILPATLDRKNLISGTLSLARNRFITRRAFALHVVTAGERTKGKFVGVARAEVDRIRQITADVDRQGETEKVRGFAVVDAVEADDFDAHATTGFTRPTFEGSQKQIGLLRQKLMLDLADTFSTVEAIEQCYWASALAVLGGRIAAIAKSIWWRGKTR